MEAYIVNNFDVGFFSEHLQFLVIIRHNNPIKAYESLYFVRMPFFCTLVVCIATTFI
jgi:hypothetical protein